MAIPPLILRIYADSSGVKRGLAQANAQVGGFRASIVRNSKLIGVGLAVGVAAGAVKAVQAAGDLGEAINATNVTFGKSRAIVRAWARDAATSAGLAEAEALQAAAGFGSMFESAGLAGDAAAEMSVKMGQLAGDLGSLRDVDPTEMLDKIRAGLAGEAEPLRRYGVFLSEAKVQQEAVKLGLAEMGEELTDAQKVQARYNIILRETEKAHGDFARTAGESLPNQLRTLRAQLINIGAQLGQVLLPVVVKVLSWVNRLLTRMGEWARTLDKEVGPAIRVAWQEVQKLWQELKPLMRELEPVAKLLGGAFLNNLRATAFAVRAVASGIRFLIKQIQTLIGWVDSAIDKLDELSRRVPGTGGQSIIPPFSGFGIIRDIFKAEGGPVRAGRPYVIGERGPELFVPGTSGTIVPNGAAAAITVNVYGDVNDAERFERKVVAALSTATRRAS